MSLEDLNVGGENQELEAILERFPAASEDIRGMLNPDLSREDFFALADKVNSFQKQPKKEGMHNYLYFSIKQNRALTVNYFENGRLTVSASDTNI